ncbi:MAG: hypothetical protein NC247_14835 [Ruminococcus flavefaciens]|nr:hypothetical protein [Ruminococcus flavefaciens]
MLMKFINERNDYSNAEGFNFLEPDVSDIITQYYLNSIETINNTIEIEEITPDNYYDLYDYHNYGGTTMNTNYNNYPQTTEQLYAPTIKIVPTTDTAARNSHPNTTIVNGSTFRIK